MRTHVVFIQIFTCCCYWWCIFPINHTRAALSLISWLRCLLLGAVDVVMAAVVVVFAPIPQWAGAYLSGTGRENV